MPNSHVAYGADVLPAGIRSRFVPDVRGLEMHVLEAGNASPDRPLVVLLHGFTDLVPNLAPFARTWFGPG